MKLDSINGKGSGKSGSKVYYVNHGQQIEREYTSSVSNPSTEAQVGQRSRFKLASQISAVIEPVLVIPRKGMQSPRNLFVKKNMGYFYANDDGAQVTFENLQITPGTSGLPACRLSRFVSIGYGFELQSYPSPDVKRVVFCFFAKGDDGVIYYITSRVVKVGRVTEQTTVVGGVMPANTLPADKDIIMLAYGMIDKGEKATALYESYNVQSGVDIATLVAYRRLPADRFTFTQTRGCTLYRSENASPTPGAQEAMLYIVCAGYGAVDITVNDVSRDRIVNGSTSVRLGETVVLTAVPDSGYEFRGWAKNGTQQPFSTDIHYTFTMEGLTDIVAQFRPTFSSGGLE